MIQIVYGSGGGNTEYLCNLLKDKLEQKGESVSLLKAKITTFDDLDAAELYIMASPTYGHGLLEKYMNKFLKSYSGTHFEIKNHNYAVIGLGDKKYDEDYYIESASILENFVAENGGNLAVDTLRIGGCVYNDLENKLDDFVASILRWMNE